MNKHEGHRSLLDMKNDRQKARWHYHRALTGGQPLQDMRTDDQRQQWHALMAKAQTRVKTK